MNIATTTTAISTNNQIISVKNLKRSFRSVKKKPGFKGAFGLLLKPEYSEHLALNDVTFSIKQGEFVGLIGANGAGKTTLLKILSGLIEATSGEAEVLGINPFSRPVHFRKQIALVMGQKAQLWWDLPALDAFDLLQAIYEIPKQVFKERLNALSALLDVEKHLNTQIRRLSLGERMKMELIGALIHWPKVIYLDEPTIGLDIIAAQKLREFLKTFNEREKATIILTSHNMDDIERLCSRVLILKTGELIYDGKPQGLMKEGECRLRVRVSEQKSIAELAHITSLQESQISVESVSEMDETQSIPSIYFNVTRKQSVTVLQSVMQSCSVIDIGVEEQSLETVIGRIYQKNS